MSTRVNREEFLALLQSVQPGTSTKDIVEQSSCIIFQNGQVLTYNDEVACRMPSKLPDGFQGAVKAIPLLALLDKLTEDDVNLDVENGELIVSGVRKKAGIRMETEVLLAVSAVEDPTDWRTLPEGFDEAVQIVSACSGTDDQRFSLTCVHFHADYLEACDNYQLARYQMKLGLKREFLVRRDALKHIVTLGMTEYSETEAWLHFRNQKGLVLSCRRYLEDFPNLDKILEFSGDPITLPPGLAEAVDKAEIFSSDNADENKVMIELRSGKLRIKGEGASGWFQEVKSIKYKGAPLSFLIAPKLLAELTRKHSECEVGAKCLKVDGGKFTYLSCLSKVKEDKEEEPKEEEEGAEPAEVAEPVRSSRTKRREEDDIPF